jgi:threonine/homoserine/homoserine lactone efflux protein
VEFLLIAAAHFLALISPGPDFFLIMQAALRLPMRYGLAVCGGIACANALYLLLAIFGLELVRELHWLMSLLRYLGGAYLVFLGLLLLKAAKNEKGANDEKVDILVQEDLRRQFLVGFLSAILNPKNAIFYLSLFTVMVSPETPMPTRCLYAAWMAAVVFLWDAGLVLTIGNRQVRARLGGSIFWIEKVSGLMLTVFGIYLPFS